MLFHTMKLKQHDTTLPNTVLLLCLLVLGSTLRCAYFPAILSELTSPLPSNRIVFLVSTKALTEICGKDPGSDFSGVIGTVVIGVLGVPVGPQSELWIVCSSRGRSTGFAKIEANLAAIEGVTMSGRAVITITGNAGLTSFILWKASCPFPSGIIQSSRTTSKRP